VSSLQPTDQDWLALCLCTESNRPEEWPYIAQVIENRRATGRWGATYRDVVLAPMQFSAFNAYTRHSDGFHEPYGLFMGVALTSKIPLLLAMRAAKFVSAPSSEPAWAKDVSEQTLHYWSPVSMVPKGSRPAWAKSAKRLYTPDGLDLERFIFAESVP